MAAACAVDGRGLRLGLPRSAPWFTTVCALVYRGLRLVCRGLRLGLPRSAPWFAAACALVCRGLRLVCRSLGRGLDWAVDGHGPKFCVTARAVVEGHSLGLL